jgi:hypothetical protein
VIGEVALGDLADIGVEVAEARCLIARRERRRLRFPDDKTTVTDMPALLQQMGADTLGEFGVGPGVELMLEPAADELTERAPRRRAVVMEIDEDREQVFPLAASEVGMYSSGMPLSWRNRGICVPT